MTGGRSIDTCPKDGTEFLAYDPVAGKFDVCVWREYWGYVWPTQSDGEYGPDPDEFQADRATMWWPLPVAE